MLRSCRALFCTVNNKDAYLQREGKRLNTWKYNQYMKQASAMSKLNSAYAFGTNELLRQKTISPEDAVKWRELDRQLLSMHQNTKELLWYSKRRISRDYASSEDGLGKYPRSENTGNEDD